MAEEENEEQIITIPLLTAKASPRTKKSKKAMLEVREHVAKHMKAELKDVWIDQSVNELVWARGIKKPPSSIRVKAVKFEDGLVEVSLPEE
ncbi:MAG TPA: 50S ribosomal protein L31e [Methanomassiliicoccales archaeon]|jgi:large subunit ribosomal protein L31e|nr:50S ribosomal protein L31e [Methanomassiliicoccales archaeon]